MKILVMLQSDSTLNRFFAWTYLIYLFVHLSLCAEGGTKKERGRCTPYEKNIHERHRKSISQAHLMKLVIMVFLQQSPFVKREGF